MPNKRGEMLINFSIFQISPSRPGSLLEPHPFINF